MIVPNTPTRPDGSGMGADFFPTTVWEINDHVLAFYLGRDVTPPSPYVEVEGNWVDVDWRLGVACYAVHAGDEAVLYDTTTLPAAARWVRRYLEQERGIRRLTIVLSHWHLDHIAGTAIFRDCPIVARTATWEELSEKRAAIEAGECWGLPELDFALPNVTIDGSFTCHVGEIEVQFHPFDIHSRDGNVMLLPADRLLFAGDTLEDPVTFVTEPERIPIHLRELERLRGLPFDRVYPCHGQPELLQGDGYTETLIDAMVEYDTNLLARVAEDGFLELPLEDFVPQALSRGTVAVWEPYRDVHRNSLALVREQHERGAYAQG